jgi:hypothetical protein
MPPFFAKGHDAIQITAPRLPDSLHQKREELFAASLDVHKAFIDAAAQKVLHNINNQMSAFTTGAFQGAEKKALQAILVDAISGRSRSFPRPLRSVNQMLGDPPERLGWLLIDEAGQALPQAAAGTIMRPGAPSWSVTPCRFRRWSSLPASASSSHYSL